LIVKPRPYTAQEAEAVDRRIRATCHPRQEGFVFDPGRYISLLTGRGAGKTTAQLMRFIRRMVRQPDANCLFIAATRQSAERLIWRDLRRLLDKLRIGAQFSEANLTCELRNGARLMLFGCDDKKDIQKLRGITYHEVGVDEVASINAELLRELIEEVIGPRMVGTLSLIGTPGKVLEGRFYEVSRPNGTEHRPYKDRELPEFADWIGWSSHAWTVRDGAAHGIAAMQEFLATALLLKQQNGWSDTNPVWLREYEGQWIADGSALVYAFRPHDDEGAMFNLWDPPRDQHGFAVLPADVKDWVYGVGVDIGWKDATAIEVFAFSPTHPSRTLWHVYEVYTSRMYAKALAGVLIGSALDHSKYGGIFGAIGGWPIALVGDFARSGGALLEELSVVYGITVKPADKPYAYKANSIELTNSMLFEGQIKLLKGSSIAAEMTTLQWVVDQFGKRTENPSQNNHGSDALIYLRDAVAPLLPSALADAPPPPASGDPDSRRRVEPEYGDANAMYDLAMLG
jgi:hypothetical protein